MSKLKDNYKFSIGDKVKIDTSLMNRKDVIKCKEDGILNLMLMKKLNIFNISSVCKGKQKTAGGYK